MADIVRGDQAAFAALYDQFSAAVFGTCRAVLRDPDHAAEVTQEVFVEAWRTASRFDSERGSVRAWLLTLAHRRAIDRVRSVQAQRDRDADYAAQVEVSYDSVTEAVERTLDGERVTRCLETLTELQREAIKLSYFGGYSYPEVARLTGTALGTIKTRIRDGLIRLRDCMGVAA
ncbi:ECF RNA polymerase sigma factor SigK [Micrococcales bacterium 31B]|nr:ECF RNA polymerase sigma factor SigK [Micrococcales bacterium 31B]